MQEAKILAEKSSKEDYCPNLLKYFGVFENNLNERLGILTEYFGVIFEFYFYFLNIGQIFNCYRFIFKRVVIYSK